MAYAVRTSSAGSGACALYSPGLDSCRACLIHVVLPVVSCGSHGSAFSGDFGGFKVIGRGNISKVPGFGEWGSVGCGALWNRREGIAEVVEVICIQRIKDLFVVDAIMDQAVRS